MPRRRKERGCNLLCIFGATNTYNVRIGTESAVLSSVKDR